MHLFPVFLFVGIVGQSQGQQNEQEVIIEGDGRVQAPNIPLADVDLTRTITTAAEYGMDRSWPMQRDHVLMNDGENPLGGAERQLLYTEFLEACSKQSNDCQRNERDRIRLNQQQPPVMQNYTHAGFAKVPTPSVAQDLLARIWDACAHGAVEERWPSGDTNVNHFQVPTKILDLSSTGRMTSKDKQILIKSVQEVLEAWTGQSLVFTSLYGIRIYQRGSILAPHVDRLPLVTSAIINVARSASETPWLLEVIGHDGKAHNITQHPGEMILYESHSVIHGRPYKLQADYYANVFVHFEPLGHSYRHAQQHDTDHNAQNELAAARYQQALQAAQQQVDVPLQFPAPDIPPYVPPDKTVEWKQLYEYEKEEKIHPKPTRSFMIPVTAHRAAAEGRLEELKEIAEKERSKIFKADHNGWRPLHEAARTGQTHVIEYLLKEGAQVNERTNNGKGGSPLWWAERKAKNKEAIAMLKKYGAVSLPPAVSFGKENSLVLEKDDDGDEQPASGKQ